MRCAFPPVQPPSKSTYQPDLLAKLLPTGSTCNQMQPKLQPKIHLNPTKVIRLRCDTPYDDRDRCLQHDGPIDTEDDSLWRGGINGLLTAVSKNKIAQKISKRGALRIRIKPDFQIPRFMIFLILLLKVCQWPDNPTTRHRKSLTVLERI